MASVSSMPMSHPPQFLGGVPSAYMSDQQYYTSVPRSLTDPQHLPMSARRSPNQSILISPRGLFHISHYHQLEAQPGDRIVIAVDFRYQSNKETFLRLVLGRRPLHTSVRRVPESNRWEITAIIPPPQAYANPTAPIPLSVQALDEDNAILDSVVAGCFVYWDHSRQTSSPYMFHRSVKASDSSETLLGDVLTSSPSSSLISLPSKGLDRPTISRSSSTRPNRSKSSTLCVRSKQANVLVRAKRYGPGEDVPESQRIILDIASPVEAMAADWAEEEIKLGRRLIRFYSQFDSQKLTVTCERIKQEEYVEGDAVISCIYRTDTNSCYVTSVDIICLLESLSNAPFAIEEKNRIRRNLEGFRPKTVSKNRSGTEDFFQQIMDFPAPKPRNIEKDVKVFDWAVLPQALDKILSKYSPLSRSKLESGSSLMSDTYSRTSSSPPLDVMSMAPSHSPNPYDSERMTSSSGSFHYTTDSTYPSPHMHGSSFSQRPVDLPYYARSDTMSSSYSTFSDSSASASSVSGTPSPRSHSFGEVQCDPHVYTPEMHNLYPCNSMPPSATMSSLTVNSTGSTETLVFDDDFTSLNTECQPLMLHPHKASLDSFSLTYA